jgi:hypothetical protein
VVLRVRRRVYVQPCQFLPLFKCLYLERCNRLSSDQTLPFDPPLYYLRSIPSLFLPLLTTRPCTFIKSVALSSVLALPSPLARIIS